MSKSKIAAIFVLLFASGVAAQTPVKKNQRQDAPIVVKQTTAAGAEAPNYFYTFERPGFVVWKIAIAHDEKGKGSITFFKNDSKDEITDPLVVSTAAMEKIADAMKALDFMNSTENYQYEKDYSHLGNITIKIVKGDKTRETKFNWTSNEKARALSNEYRKLADQYVWVFEMNLAIVNQPLEAPRLVDSLEGYLRRDEISDPMQLVPFLRQLANDERIPLIARNHATRIADRLEKK